MPVEFLTAEHRSDYGRFVAEPTAMDLARYFHLDDADRQIIGSKRGDHNRLGFAVQLTTVRFLGRFLDDTTQIPPAVLNALARQLGLNDPARCMTNYRDQRQRLRHIEEIRRHGNYREISEPLAGFKLTRWLYAQCWTGTDRPTVLFERATSWLLAHIRFGTKMSLACRRYFICTSICLGDIRLPCRRPVHAVSSAPCVTRTRMPKCIRRSVAP